MQCVCVGGVVYLSQSYVGLLDEVLQTATQRPGQQEVGGFTQHVIDLCGTGHTNNTLSVAAFQSSHDNNNNKTTTTH